LNKTLAQDKHLQTQ